MFSVGDKVTIKSDAPSREYLTKSLFSQVGTISKISNLGSAKAVYHVDYHSVKDVFFFENELVHYPKKYWYKMNDNAECTLENYVYLTEEEAAIVNKALIAMHTDPIIDEGWTGSCSIDLENKIDSEEKPSI